MSKIELLCIDTDGTMTDGSLIYGFMGNSSLTQSLRELEKSALDRQQVLSRADFPTQPTNLTQDTRIANDSSDSKNLSSQNSANPPQQTIEGIAVEVAEFLPNFECETRLGVCEHSKFGKSPQDAPKSELPTEIAKVFNVKDGLALAYWAKTLNRKVAIITGRSSEILRARAKELGIDELLFMGIRDKGAKVRELKDRFALDSSQIATIGDDLNDIPMFKESHFNFAPSDCAEAMKALPHTTILNAKGGCGAVREAIEIILKKESLYDEFVSQFI